MRRKDKEITDKKEMEDILREAHICHLGMAVDNTPYVVPLHYGYEPDCIYIHCAKKGRKLDMIKQNSRVCFQVEADVTDRFASAPACDSTATYRSVIGYGTAMLLDDFEEKKQGLDVIMKHYHNQPPFEYNPKDVERTCIIKIEITEMSGKKSG